jgi:hypothetical protein
MNETLTDPATVPYVSETPDGEESAVVAGTPGATEVVAPRYPADGGFARTWT